MKRLDTPIQYYNVNGFTSNDHYHVLRIRRNSVTEVASVINTRLDTRYDYLIAKANPLCE